MTKTFTPLVISSSFYTCSMPLNLDTYRYCSFQCEYCFMKNRVVGKREEHDIKPNIKWLHNKFKKVYDEKSVDKENFIETLLKNRIDLHCGTKSEAFQPREQTDQYTKKIIDLCNHYNQHIVFTTKSDSYYDVDVDPSLHSFQFSVTNHYNDRYLEPNVPSLENRIKFYNKLKDEGFHVGIRIMPFIPNVTNLEEILDCFEDVEYVYLSHQLRLLPHLNHDDFLNYIKCSKNDFTTYGLTTMKKEILYKYLKPCLDFLEEHGYSYSTRFMNMGNNNCCCGDDLVNKSTTFDTLHLMNKYGDNWTLDDGLKEIGEYKDCRCDSVFTSNRRHGCKTVEEFYKYRWDKPRTTFHPSKQFKPKNASLFDFQDKMEVINNG